MVTARHSFTASKIIAIALATVAVILFALLFYEAKKEVYFLCNNFKSTNSVEHVVKQLDTASFSSYTLEPTETGSEIVFSSAFNLRIYTCVIEFDKEKKVRRASFANSVVNEE